MMKNQLFKLVPLFILLGWTVHLVSCRKNQDLPDELIANLGGYRPDGDKSIDNWILDNLTKPYNVNVKYQYDPFEVDYTKNTVPPKRELVVPVMKFVQHCMISPYIAVKDSALAKKIVPKTWVLMGSAEYNDNGTIVLGTAEGANKITVMDINKFVLKDSVLRNIAYTVNHETGHVLHQNKMYSPGFKFINPEFYTTTWYNVEDTVAMKNGFVRNYAYASPDEDFVETIAFLLVHGQEKYDQLVSKASENGKKRFRLKEQYVVEYFKERWEIDFRSLQREVDQGIKTYLSGK